MNNNTKEKVKPIYSELQGYLSQAPLADKAYFLYESPIWEQLHGAINELNNITGDNYDKFRLTVIQDESGAHIITHEYRSKLNGLIMHLHGKYFEEEITPFSGRPNTVVSQTQAQIQSTQVSILLELQSFIDKKLYNSELKEEEKSFLQTIKDNLPTVKTTVELVNLILQTAKTLGLDVSQIIKLFS